MYTHIKIVNVNAATLCVNKEFAFSGTSILPFSQIDLVKTSLSEEVIQLINNFVIDNSQHAAAAVRITAMLTYINTVKNNLFSEKQNYGDRMLVCFIAPEYFFKPGIDQQCHSENRPNVYQDNIAEKIYNILIEAIELMHNDLQEWLLVLGTILSETHNASPVIYVGNKSNNLAHKQQNYNVFHDLFFKQTISFFDTKLLLQGLDCFNNVKRYNNSADSLSRIRIADLKIYLDISSDSIRGNIRQIYCNNMNLFSKGFDIYIFISGSNIYLPREARYMMKSNGYMISNNGLVSILSTENYNNMEEVYEVYHEKKSPTYTKIIAGMNFDQRFSTKKLIGLNKTKIKIPFAYNKINQLNFVYIYDSVMTRKVLYESLQPCIKQSIRPLHIMNGLKV